jgi:hypothetical protein
MESVVRHDDTGGNQESCKVLPHPFYALDYGQAADEEKSQNDHQKKGSSGELFPGQV